LAVEAATTAAVEAAVVPREEGSVDADADADEIVNLSIFNCIGNSQLTTTSSASKNRTRPVLCRNSP